MTISIIAPSFAQLLHTGEKLGMKLSDFARHPIRRNGRWCCSVKTANGGK